MSIKWTHLVLVVLVLDGLAMLSAAPGFSQSAPVLGAHQAEILKTLGEAYSKDAEVELTRVETTVIGTTTADPEAWAARLAQALAVGYAPAPGSFRVLPWRELKSIMQIEMAGNRSPEDVAKQVAAAGNIVVEVSWHFAGTAPMMSYAVFTPAGDPLFDTMLSLPLLKGPIFSVGHGD